MMKSQFAALGLFSIFAISACTMMPVEDRLSVQTSPAAETSPGAVQMSPEETTAWKEGIRKVVQAHLPELRACWEDLRQTHAEAQGKIVVEWTINVAGRAENVRLTDVDPLMDNLQPCIAKRFGEWTFPTTPQPVLADVKYPLFFRKNTRLR